MRMFGSIRLAMAVLMSAGLLGVLSPAAWAQSEVSATASAGATVVVPVTIIGIQSLSFGGVQHDGSSTTGTVFIQIDRDGNHTRTATPGAVINPLGRANFHPAKWEITGPPGASYTVLGPDTVIQVRDMSGDQSAELIVYGIYGVSVNGAAGTPGTTNGDPFSGPNTGLIGDDGTDILFVAGTLEVDPLAEKGRYRGTITVTINLQ